MGASDTRSVMGERGGVGERARLSPIVWFTVDCCLLLVGGGWKRGWGGEGTALPPPALFPWIGKGWNWGCGGEGVTLPRQLPG